MHTLLLEIEEAVELLGRGGERCSVCAVGRWWGGGSWDIKVRNGGHRELADALAFEGIW